MGVTSPSIRSNLIDAIALKIAGTAKSRTGPSMSPRYRHPPFSVTFSGLWVEPGGGEGAKQWINMLAELRNRGVSDASAEPGRVRKTVFFGIPELGQKRRRLLRGAVVHKPAQVTKRAPYRLEYGSPLGESIPTLPPAAGRAWVPDGYARRSDAQLTCPSDLRNTVLP